MVFRHRRAWSGRANSVIAVDSLIVIRIMIGMTLYQDVVTRLGIEICAGRYPPGRVIPPEPVLGANLGVSRIVVREAVKALVSKGMLETRRRTGTVVLDPSRWSLLDPEIVTWRAAATGIDLALANDIMELRRIVEPAAARLAAERARAADRQALRAAYEAMVRAVAGEGNYPEADLAFHQIIIKACANPFVSQLQSVMVTVLRIGFERVSETPGGPARSLPMHRKLCEAIEEGDALKAERAVLKLIEGAETDLRRLLRAETRLIGVVKPRRLPGESGRQLLQPAPKRKIATTS
jgi:GntR family transcriptional regulator, galactonate operon transcriptional repressor